MVAYEGVVDANPKTWATAADEWHALAKHALGAAKDLREYGAKPLADNWTDEVGATAAAEFEKLANRLESAYDILLAVNMVADGMTTTIETAQSTLHAATDLAARHGLEIAADGTIADPSAGAGGTDSYRAEIQDLIDQAVEQVTTADKLASTEFAKLAAQTGVTDPDKALGDLQEHASHVQMRMLAADIPVGEDRATARRWWNGLTPEQRKDLMLAQPVALANLDGIPADVEQELRGSDGKYDRVKMVEYALANWNKADPTDFGNNCANFVSNALSHAGMKEKTSFWGPADDDTWMAGPRTGIDAIDKRVSYSDSWAAAENQQNFMLSHGGSEVPQAEAKPGDIIYYEQAGTADTADRGNTHHAAIVTAVMPDGEIKYTQHNNEYQNVSLEGRLPSTEKNEGDQNLRFVRPDPDWY
ncbi:amidase domain-containing protein [Streptomyces endophyticus]|uniref:Amidase domain-containing protein n=1 Tax=Streptomyces endophyticus TaxID=714166 RepID=A0ABU6FFB2_9ACTN|nr:amidase domain-containing protein [Streptomyces endophyticus]MEB8342674.1 amidase domain-containing protein [Streptomyces endophyticus]